MTKLKKKYTVISSHLAESIPSLKIKTSPANESEWREKTTSIWRRKFMLNVSSVQARAIWRAPPGLLARWARKREDHWRSIKDTELYLSSFRNSFELWSVGDSKTQSLSKLASIKVQHWSEGKVGHVSNLAQSSAVIFRTFCNPP